MSSSSRLPVLTALLAAAFLVAACQSPEERAAGHLESAQSHLEAKDFVKAKLELRNALQVQPKNAEANYLLATVLEREEDVRGTLGQLQLAIDADNGHVAARTKLGLYYVAGRMPREAREQADEVLKLAPDKADSHYLAAKVLLLEDKPADAIVEATRARDLAPDSGEIVGFLALLHSRQGDLKTALATLDEGIRVADDARDWFVDLNANYEDKRKLSESKIAPSVDSRIITNMAIGIQAAEWNVQLYADNLLDDDTVRWATYTQDFKDGMFGGSSGGEPRDNVPFAILPPPRVVGLRATYRFGE